MPITVSWGNPEKTAVYAVFGENWTLEEAHTMIDEMYALTSSVNHTVHTIMDFTDSHSSPAKLLTTGRHIENRTVPNSGVSVIVKANAFMKTMSQVITRLFLKETPMYFAESREEAFQIIERHERVNAK